MIDSLENTSGLRYMSLTRSWSVNIQYPWAIVLNSAGLIARYSLARRQ